VRGGEDASVVQPGTAPPRRERGVREHPIGGRAALGFLDNRHSEGPVLLTVSGIEAYRVKRAGQTDWLVQRLGSAASAGTTGATCASRRADYSPRPVPPVLRRRGPARCGRSDWHGGRAASEGDRTAGRWKRGVDGPATGTSVDASPRRWCVPDSADDAVRRSSAGRLGWARVRRGDSDSCKGVGRRDPARRDGEPAHERGWSAEAYGVDAVMRARRRRRKP
jgi:hypothetical protein